jgi:hypothetical protein
MNLDPKKVRRAAELPIEDLHMRRRPGGMGDRPINALHDQLSIAALKRLDDGTLMIELPGLLRGDRHYNPDFMVHGHHIVMSSEVDFRRKVVAEYPL